MEQVSLLADSRQKTLKKINNLLEAIERDPFSGIGKPKPLKGNWQGFYSRRIDDSNRIVYTIEKDMIFIAQCGGHYEE